MSEDKVRNPIYTDRLRGTGVADLSQVRRILLVSLDNVGDLVFASSLAPPLRSAFPSAELSVWCKDYAAGIAPFIPGVERVFASDPFWDRSPGRGKGSLRHFLSVWWQVQRSRFDMAIVTSRHWRGAAAVAVAGIPIRVGYDRRRVRAWLTHPVPAADRQKPVVEELGRLLQPLHLPAVTTYALDIEPAARRRDTLRARLGTAPVAALHPFAGRRDRCVEMRAWHTLAAGLHADGFRSVWVGSSTELATIREGGETLEGAVYSDSVASAELSDLAVLLSCATLYAGHDSGPLHIAAALGVPSLGIFAPGEPARTFPQGPALSRVLAAARPQEISGESMLAAARALVLDAGITQDC